jgi:hypothetical protein
MSTSNTYVPVNFEIRSGQKETYSNQARLDTLSTNANTTSLSYIPVTATSVATSFKVPYNFQNVGTLYLASRRGQGESYASPITYYVDLGNDFYYQIENNYRKSFGIEQLLFESSGAFDTTINFYPIQKGNSLQLIFRVAPYTRIAVYNGLIPSGNPGDGDPYYFYTFYNRFDKLNNDNEIPALSGATAIPTSLVPAPCFDFWHHLYFFTPTVPANLYTGFVGPDVGDWNTPYNETVNGKKQWVNLPREFLPENE